MNCCAIPEATRRFVEVTHERYRQTVGQYFGGVCPAIFTDEPQTTCRGAFSAAAGLQELNLPWTDDFGTSFAAAYGTDPLDVLPEVFWELPDGRISVWRYRYHEHATERFASGFADVLGDWCARHGLPLTGHLHAEQNLTAQTGTLGEAMRQYRAFHIPGVDILCDGLEGEFNTVKQAQSVARQDGREGLISELYGVTNWTFDFAAHKRQGDWQAALGVLFRVQHLAMVSMKGEAKRDYPASIGYQSPWHEEYRVVEDHFARLGSVLARGEPVARVGVIHPIESFWLCYGPLDQTGEERSDRERRFAELTRWLLYGFSDFDFISEALLPERCSGPMEKGFPVGAMRYDVILVPHLRTLRATTLERLERFADTGGAVLFLGDIPTLVDALPSDRPARLAARCRCLPFDRQAVLRALAPYRDVEAIGANGVQTDRLLHQLRRDGDARTLFICNTQLYRMPLGKHYHFDVFEPAIRVTGEWQVTHLDTLTGQVEPCAVRYEGGRTVWPWEFLPHQSALFRLEPGRRERGNRRRMAHLRYRPVTPLEDPVPVTLAEPNVLLLDYAECRIGDGDWRAPEYILKLNAVVPEALGIPGWGPWKCPVQPWSDPTPAEPLAEVRLRLRFRTEVTVATPSLALEDAETTAVFLDGRRVVGQPTGFFTDRAIRTIPLSSLAPGEHVLELVMAFTRKTMLESVYLLGDFGVRVAGRHTCLTAPVRELAFGDIVRQGLPFYGGNLTYHCRFTASGEELAVSVPHFGGAMVKAVLDGDRELPIAFAPYRAELGRLHGEHRIDLVLYGNRGNCFGQLHHVYFGAIKDSWWGPNSWTPPGTAFVDAYQFDATGILAAPLLEVLSKVL